MIVNEIKPDTIPTWKAEFLRQEHTNVVLEKIKAEIKELADYDNVDVLVEVVRIIDKYIEGSESE